MALFIPKPRRAFTLGRLFTSLFLALLLCRVGQANTLALPPVGATELKILSPTLIELILVTTKDPDPAPVTTWNFVGANYALTLPAATEFQVLVNGSAVPVSQVGFRRRPVYAPLKVRDLRIGNSLFLKLAMPLVDGQTISVRNPSGTLWNDSTTTFSGTVNPTRVNPAIHVNQVGYIPNQPKKAMVGYYLGSMGELPIASSTFNLIDAASGAVRFTGALSLRRDLGYTYSPTPYQNVYEADFTAFQTPGEYVVQVPGMGASQRFLINDGTAAVFARSIALGLYHQRCGGKNELPFTRHEHDACHIAPAEVPTASFTAVNATLAGTSYDYANNPLHTARQLNSVDASLYPFVNRGPIDVSGGHHDAGDYSKYTINSAGLIHHLVFAADAFAGVAALDNLGLPESGDGKSDLLQEAKWEADFLAKMQDADGGFYFLVYPRDRRYEDDVLPDHGDSQVVFPKTTAVTAAAVAALAEMASSPTFKAQFPHEAAAYLDKARKGWTFLMNAINTHGKNGSYQKITHYGNEFMHDDELAWAAAALFVATGDPAFHNQLKAWYDPSSPNTRRWTWWRLFEGWGCAARTYAFAARTGRLPAALLDPAYVAKCDAEIIAAGDDVARFAQQSAYGTSFPDLNKAYRSAGWYFSSERAFELATANQLRPSITYSQALISNMNYEGGCNPVNMPYITGLGWQSWRDIVHQYAQNDYQALPPAGIPLGNVQAGFAYLHNYKQSLGQLCYPPDGASTAPYPFYDRWGDSFNTTTEFVVVDQSRSLATYAHLFANTATAASKYTRVTPTISGLPASIPAEQMITATFQAPGIDLTGARILWEARDQQPFIGNTFSFSAKNPGLQWLEAEALLPDGRRLICKTNFTATYSTTVPPNAFKSAPGIISGDLVAAYRADGSLTDATGKSGPLTLSGNARMNSENLGWMASRSGQALRFDDLGDKATVSIPASLIYSAGTSEISLEAMVFVEAYKGWNRSPAKLLCLERTWNASLKWYEDTYTGAHLTGGTALDCTGPTLASALPVGQWHHLRISISTTGYALHVNGAHVASVQSSELSGWSSGTATLELGNFSGWVDEIIIRAKGTSTSDNSTVLTRPAAPTNLRATTLSEAQVALSWSDNASNEEGYRVYRSIDSINYVECGTASANANAATISAPAPDTLYYFAVKSFNAAGESVEAVSSARTFPTIPLVPVGLSTVSQPRAIELRWNVSPGATSYNIQRAVHPLGPFSPVASLNANYWSDSDLAYGLTYYYIVSSKNAAGESAYSAAVSGKVFSATANLQFLGFNTERKGNWRGAIGAEGYLLARDAWKIPNYAQVSFSSPPEWFWAYTTWDSRALFRPPGTSRLASCWYHPTSFEMNLKITDGKSHKLSLYNLDWDRAQRVQKIEIIDAVTGQVMHTVQLQSFSEGVYVEYLVQGHVRVRYTRIAGPNAVLNGVFLDAE